MPVLTAFLWGTGLSLGMCVGLVAWSIYRQPERFASRQYERLCLRALQERNRLNGELIEQVERIADAAEGAERIADVAEAE